MKLLLVLLALLLGPIELFAQACRPVEIATDPLKRKLLLEYIGTCYQNHYFFEDKGVVELVIYQDEGGCTRWYLSAQIDDRYRAMPPEQYALFDNDVILQYQGTETGQRIPIAGNPASRNACIQIVVDGRVYHYADTPRYTETINAKGRRKKVQMTTLTGGATHNDLIIRFNKDGTITKFQPV